jgi:hypothetical protein
VFTARQVSSGNEANRGSWWVSPRTEVEAATLASDEDAAVACVVE